MKIWRAGFSAEVWDSEGERGGTSDCGVTSRYVRDACFQPRFKAEQ